MGAPKWSAEHDDVLRARYRADGAAACSKVVGRSVASVRKRAQDLGIARDRADIYAWTSEAIDAEIRRTYAGKRPFGYQKALAARINRTPRWVASRAVQLGVQGKVEKRRWTPEEDALLRQNAHLSILTVMKRLKRLGSKRTAIAVGARLKQLRPDRNLSDRGLMTKTDAAEMLGVSRDQITRWVRNGWLIVQPDLRNRNNGYLIHEADLAWFVVGNLGEIKLARLEPCKQWLVEAILRHCSWRDQRHAPMYRRAASIALAFPEMSNGEIADKLGTTSDNIKVLLSRARTTAAGESHGAAA